MSTSVHKNMGRQMQETKDRLGVKGGEEDGEERKKTNKETRNR